MHPHIPILPTARIPSPQRIHRHGIQRPEMALDPPNLILEDLVVEARLEFPLPAARLGDVHGGLPTPEHDERFLGGEGGRVEGGFRGVLFQGAEVAGGEEFGEFVLGGGDEVGSVGGHLDVLDLHVDFVGLEVVEEFARLT